MYVEMSQIDTKYFGNLPYPDESILEFPFGLPGFEGDSQFLLIELPEHAPLVFLQSMLRKDLCFLALPIQVVDREYRLGVTAEDLRALDLQPTRQPELATEVLVLALLSVHDKFSPSANLMAPIVINLKTRKALQAIRQDSLYSHQQPLHLQATEGTC